MKRLEETSITPSPDFEYFAKVLTRTTALTRVPFYELFVVPEVMSKLLGKAISSRVDTVEFYYRAGYDYVPAWPRVAITRGSLSNSAAGYPVGCRKDYEEYSWPDLSAIDFSEFELLSGKLPNGMKIIGQIWGIFEQLESICGYENLCMLLYDDRELVCEILDRLEEIYVAMYEGMAQRDDVGALVISDDMGFHSQTLISPDDLRELILPRHKKLAAVAHQYHKPCILHSCGNLQAIMDEIIGSGGIDAKHSYEDSILPVTEAKRLYGDRITILGGFDIGRLCRSTEEEVAAHTEYLIRECGRGGGYALGSGNSIADYVPLSNYLAMLEVGWKLR